MKKERKLTALAGVFYVLGTVFGVLSMLFTATLRGDDNLLGLVNQNPNSLVTGALFVLLMGLSLSFMAIVLYPVLQRQNAMFAMGYVVFRGGIEMVMYIASVLSWLFLLPLSRYVVQNGLLMDAGVNAFAQTLLNTDQIALISTIVFLIGAIMFYVTLYQGRLVPRWLSGWGLIAAVPYLAAYLLQIFSVISDADPIFAVLVAPLAIQEMVLAGWMIVKGFNTAAVKQTA